MPPIKLTSVNDYEDCQRMVDNYSHQNIIVNEGEILRFMPNQIYIVNEPLNFGNVERRSENLGKNNKMIEYKEVSCYEGTGVSCLNRRNPEQFTYLQMLWNEPDSKFQEHFMALNDNILTDQNNSVAQNLSNSLPVYEIDDSDEEDDVVFVKAYPIQNHEVQNVEKRKELVRTTCKDEKKPRRNPLRKARNSKFAKNYDDENIYEEDFCMLDSSDEESSPDEYVSTSPSPKEEEPQNLTVKDMKKWPVNGLHERPEFNIITQKIEKFDYTIREIQSIVKKPKLEDTKKSKPRRKPAVKKYVTKKRGTKRRINKEVDSKVPIDSLKDLVEENFNILSDFIKKVRNQYQQGLHVCHGVVLGFKNTENEPLLTNSAEKHYTCLKNYETLMMNQSRFLSLLNRISFQEAYRTLMNKSESF